MLATCFVLYVSSLAAVMREHAESRAEISQGRIKLKIACQTQAETAKRCSADGSDHVHVNAASPPDQECTQEKPSSLKLSARALEQ